MDDYGNWQEDRYSRLDVIAVENELDATIARLETERDEARATNARLERENQTAREAIFILGGEFAEARARVRVLEAALGHAEQVLRLVADGECALAYGHPETEDHGKAQALVYFEGRALAGGQS